MPNPTLSIREKFSEDFINRFADIKGSKGPVTFRIVAEWAFLEGMNIANEIASKCNSDEGCQHKYIKQDISDAIKEFKDEHPK